MARCCYDSHLISPLRIYVTMLRETIRNLPGVPLLIKMNTDIEDWWFDLRYGTETTADRRDRVNIFDFPN